MSLLSPFTCFAPGRINLIGEHIDYNGGMVLPAAISIGITAEVIPTGVPILDIQSDIDGGLVHRINLLHNKTVQSPNDWTRLVRGVVSVLEQKAVTMQGATVRLRSSLPVGSGLSSSACIGVLTTYILRRLANENTNNTVLASEAQRAENEYMGVPCGIMDQFVIASGKAEHALLLNCETLAYEYIPIQFGDYELLILNSNKPRQLVESKYSERKDECDTALRLLRRRNAKLPNLCSTTLDEVSTLEDAVLRRRAFHVVSEQQRVLAAKDALVRHDVHQLGHLFNASHESLHRFYEVTGYELNTLVRAAQAHDACIGARMTGAGFGGCAIALVHRERVAEFTQKVGDLYHKKTGLRAAVLPCTVVDGVG